MPYFSIEVPISGYSVYTTDAYNADHAKELVLDGVAMFEENIDLSESSDPNDFNVEEIIL